MITVEGKAVPPDMLGTLVDSTGADPATLRAQLARDGYVRLRGALDATAVLTARAEVLARLEEVGEVAGDVATGMSQRAVRHRDLGVFWRSVSEGPALRAVAHGPALRALAGSIIDAAVTPFDFLWLRAMVEGRASPLHFDHVYMNRGSARVVTCWIPLGAVPLAAGPIVFVENAHRRDELTAPYRGLDVDRDGKPGSFAENPVDLARRLGTRLLSADFAPGDVVFFGMFSLHGSLDNNQGGGRIRLSCDVRYQPADDARDDRWFGAPPPGHGGKSYGGMQGAQPLGAPGLRR